MFLMESEPRSRSLPLPAGFAKPVVACARHASAWGFLFVSLTFPAVSEALERRCARAQAVAGIEKSLPNVAERVRAGEPIRIVALGSSSTEGTPDMPREAIFPAVLGRELSREMLVPVEVVNKGRGGETIPRMVERLERDVISQKPDLVIWQLGVNDVLQFDSIDRSVEMMRVALARLRALRVPVVLVDLQSSPLVDRAKDTPAMQEAIVEAAKTPGVMHFHRRAFMKRLVEMKEAVAEELIQKDGLHMTRLGHFCTGALLARQIARGGLMRREASAVSFNRP